MFFADQNLSLEKCPALVLNADYRPLSYYPLSLWSWQDSIKSVFLCPNGHEKCSINPVGYQWFDLTRDDPEYILEQSKKAEIKLKQFIEDIKNQYSLRNSEICLSGFSQGSMMSINLGLTNNENYNCVVGFSGKIINQEDLIKRKTSSTKMLLLHGDKDEVVSPTYLLEAKDFLIRNSIEIEAKMIKDCEHHIPVEASSIALNYIKNNFFQLEF